MIRYFATNRDMQKLGRAAGVKKSDDRRNLSKGGYYFADMEKYMRFYLGTTDANTMPANAPVMNSEKLVFDDFLRHRAIGTIAVCVHGFNVDLFDAFTWFRVLTDTMRHLPDVGQRMVTTPEELATRGDDVADGSLTAFIGFSWPSNGDVLSYRSDQREAIGSTAAFAALLGRLKATGKSVKLVAHSMGNFLACHTFADLVEEVIVPPAVVQKDKQRKLGREVLTRARRAKGTEVVEREDWLVDTYIMIAPDVERRHVTKCASTDSETDYVGQFYAGLQHLVKKKVNVYSRFDGALAVSNLEKVPREAALSVGGVASKLSFGLLDFLERNPDERWEKRLGEAPAPINASPGFVSVNATELAARKIDHSDHIDSEPVVARIAAELEI